MGERKEWIDGEKIAWAEVRGMCGFWDGSCRAVGCDVGGVGDSVDTTRGWHAVNNI